MKHTVSEIKLPNGIAGLLIHVPDASVMTFEYNFRAGEYLVEKSKWETAHIMEHMLLGANELVPKARAFQAEFEKNGAYNNASTGSYDVIYEAECADFEWDRIFGLMLTAMTKPLFLEEEFEAEFGNVREELNARSNNHFRYLNLALREKYGFCVKTDQERLMLMNNVSVDDIKKHFERTHTSSNLRFVIAGNLNATRRKTIEKMLANIELPQGTGRIDLPDEFPKKIDTPLHIHNDTVENLYFYLDTFANHRLTDPESDNLSLINTMLTETLYSRILGTAREKGLVYNMSSGFGQTKNSANWWFGAQVMPQNLPALFDIMVHELSEVFSGKISNEDIESAKQYALGRYQRSGQTVGGVANGYSYRYFFDDGIDDYYKLPERIAAITKQGIVDVSKSMFIDNVWGIGTLGNANDEFVRKLQEQVAPLWRVD
ncbi:MAG: Insulinase family protein [Patescibacteria group bacterium]|nr:Insulinase family protein [Patescibacteria group bacterium]